MSSSSDFWIKFNPAAISFIQNNSADLTAYCRYLNVDLDAAAAAIAREVTGAIDVYQLHNTPQDFLRTMVNLDVATHPA
jgi:hypothetical protein